MQLPPALHRWDLTPAEARELQRTLAGRVDATTTLGPVTRLAAADVSFDRGSPVVFAAVVVIDVATGRLLDSAGAVAPALFPYVPGLLSFREAPAVLAAFEKLSVEPDAVLCDGQGIAHPRRLGLASHIGLWLDRPTIGCAKSRLCGTHEEVGPSRGSTTPLIDGDEVIGRVVRTRRNVKPLYVSPGHRCDIDSAVRLVLEQVGKYRLPEPARMAHEVVNAMRRRAAASPLTDVDRDRVIG
jgi:deoxyribonuclease V